MILAELYRATYSRHQMYKTKSLFFTSLFVLSKKWSSLMSNGKSDKEY